MKTLLAAFGMVLTVAFFSTGCGYLKSGQWDDDPRNWNRAFGGPVPSGWSVLHSRYWRNPHWSYEGGYYFAVKVSHEARQKLVTQPDLIEYESNQPTQMEGACLDRPKRFAPKPPASYDAWRSDHGTGNYRLFVDKQGSDVFFSDCQI